MKTEAKLIEIGRSVVAKSSACFGLVNSGTKGIIQDKFTPAHAAGCWYVIVKWDTGYCSHINYDSLSSMLQY